MPIPTNQIPLPQLPAQHREVHKVIKINPINYKVMQNHK